MTNLTLLYAEDDEQSRKNYTFVLEEYFTKVYAAKDGKEALEMYEENKPDVLLLDISMPFVNGLEVAEKVRENDKKIPIIMLTGHSDKEKLLKAIPLGIFKYLIKPIENHELVKTIETLTKTLQETDILCLKEKLTWDKTTTHLYYENHPVKLTKKERKFMLILLNNIGKYFSHHALIIQVWDNEIPDESHDNKLHQLVYRLNKKITDITKFDMPLIENAYTLGYRIH